jgi:hypothetical protein
MPELVLGIGNNQYELSIILTFKKLTVLEGDIEIISPQCGKYYNYFNQVFDEA